jgi:hypothetical protein
MGRKKQLSKGGQQISASPPVGSHPVWPGTPLWSAKADFC